MSTTPVLLKCAVCGGDVASTAAACPRCGAPPGGVQPRVIEQTAKKWKAWQLLFGFLFVVGLPATMCGRYSETEACGPIGGGLAVVGLVGYLATRMMAWWHHG